MTRTLATAVLAGLVGVSTAAPPPKTQPKKSEQELLTGVWKRTETTQGDKSDLFLTYDGKAEMKVNRNLDGSGWGYTAKYELKVTEKDDGKDKVIELPYESVSADFMHGETLKVLKLTEDEFEYEDPAGIREKYKKVTDEPKAGKKK